MGILKAIPFVVEFGVITLIGFRTISTTCFNPGDINLSLGALIFAVIVDLYLIKNKEQI